MKGWFPCVNSYRVEEAKNLLVDSSNKILRNTPHSPRLPWQQGWFKKRARMDACRHPLPTKGHLWFRRFLEEYQPKL